MNSQTADKLYHWDALGQAWLRADEDDLQPVTARRQFMSPEQYDASANTPLFWQDCLQDSLHTALDWYLNGAALSAAGRILTRSMRRPKGRILTLLRRIRHLATEKATWSHPPKGISPTKSTPGELSHWYAHLDRQLQHGFQAGDATEVAPPPAGDLRKRPVLAAIARRCEAQICPSGSQMFVQGSVATDEAIGYSDLDLWLLLSRSAVADPRVLQSAASASFRIRRLLFQFDPLQHHGVMLATEVDLARYPESYLPIDAWRRARFLAPPDGRPITLVPRPSAVSAQISFLGVLSTLRQVFQENISIRNVFRAKGILSTIMLLPSLFEGSMGRPCFKADSYDRVKHATTPELWAIIDECSEIRLSWRYSPKVWRKAGQALVRNPFVFQNLMQRGLAGNLGSDVACEMPESWQQRATALAESLWEQICNSSTT